MTYWAITHGTEGLLYYLHDYTKRTPANTSTPYPRSGAEWIPEVWVPLAAELSQIAGSVGDGVVSGAVSNNSSDIISQVFHDTNTDEYFLIALNSTTGSETPTFTLSLPAELARAIPLDPGGAPIGIKNGMFSDVFSSYDVRVYKLVPKPDGDGMTDVGL